MSLQSWDLFSFACVLKIQEPAFFILPGETTVVKNLECNFIVESKNMNKRSHNSRSDLSLSLPLLLTGAVGFKVGLTDELTFQVLQSPLEQGVNHSRISSMLWLWQVKPSLLLKEQW